MKKQLCIALALLATSSLIAADAADTGLSACHLDYMDGLSDVLKERPTVAADEIEKVLVQIRKKCGESGGSDYKDLFDYLFSSYLLAGLSAASLNQSAAGWAKYSFMDGARWYIQLAENTRGTAAYQDTESLKKEAALHLGRASLLSFLMATDKNDTNPLVQHAASAEFVKNGLYLIICVESAYQAALSWEDANRLLCSAKTQSVDENRSYYYVYLHCRMAQACREMGAGSPPPFLAGVDTLEDLEKDLGKGVFRPVGPDFSFEQTDPLLTPPRFYGFLPPLTPLGQRVQIADDKGGAGAAPLIMPPALPRTSFDQIGDLGEIFDSDDDTATDDAATSSGSGSGSEEEEVLKEPNNKRRRRRTEEQILRDDTLRHGAAPGSRRKPQVRQRTSY